MIKFAVCDDEKKDCIELSRYIEDYCKRSKLLYTIEQFESGEQLLKSSFRPDILFLDIIMYKKDGIQIGMEIKRRIPNLLVVYITNLSEKISIAINRIHAFGYLEKPIKRESIYLIIADAIRNLKYNGEETMVTFLSVNKTIIKLHASDIYYFEYINRIVKVVMESGEYLCRGKIRDIAVRMEVYGFIMSHQSFVVNLYQVERISHQVLIMRNGSQVCLAQKRASSVRKQLMMLAQKSEEGEGK